MTLVLKCISVYACVAVVCKRNTIHGKDCRESVRSAVSRGDGKHGSFIRGNEIERIERMSALHIYICVMGVLCAVCNCRQPFTLQTLCINVCVCNNSCSTLGVVADFVCFFFFLHFSHFYYFIWCLFASSCHGSPRRNTLVIDSRRSCNRLQHTNTH